MTRNQDRSLAFIGLCAVALAGAAFAVHKAQSAAPEVAFNHDEPYLLHLVVNDGQDEWVVDTELTLEDCADSMLQISRSACEAYNVEAGQ